VIHFQSPGSPVSYYQQVGRAGRALAASCGVLLRGAEDERIQNHLIDRAFAAPDVVRDVLAAFDRAEGPLSLNRVQIELNVRRTTLEQVPSNSMSTARSDGSQRRCTSERCSRGSTRRRASTR